MDLKRVIYVSQPFGFDEAMLNGILLDARRENLRRGVTGALICRADIYLQLIEGDPRAIDDTYARIAQDDRHQAVTPLLDEAADRRLFPRWAMLDDPYPSRMWTRAEVAAGAVCAATRPQLLDVFARLAAANDA